MVVLASLTWTVWSWDGLSQIRHRLSEIGVFAGLLVFTEVCFIVGAVLVASGLGKSVFANTGSNPFKWARALVQVRGSYHDMAVRISESSLFRAGFNLNWFGAVGTGIVAAVGIVVVLPYSAWGIMILPLLDIAASIGWRLPVDHKLREIREASKIIVRPATEADISDYLEAVDSVWPGEMSVAEEKVRSRININPGGILVARRGVNFCGMASTVQISHYDYENPPSWYDISDDGWCTTHNPSGKILYGIDLTVPKGAPRGVAEALMVSVGSLAIRRGVKYAMLGGRIPRYHKYSSSYSPDEYIDARRSTGRHLDPEIELYSSIIGLKVLKPIPDYIDDPGSENWGVLLRWRNPFYHFPCTKIWAKLFFLLYRAEKKYQGMKG